MKSSIRWIIIVALMLMAVVLVVIGPTARPQAASAEPILGFPQPSATPNEQSVASPMPSSASPGIPVTGGTPPLPSASTMTKLRDQVCVRQISYAILALPSSATFQVASLAPTPATVNTASQPVCKSVLTLGDTQTVVCSGPDGGFLPLHVVNNGIAEDVTIPFKSCASSSEADEAPSPLPQQPAVSTVTPMPQPTATSQPPEPTDTLPTPLPLPTLPISTP